MIKRLLQVGIILAGFASMPSWGILISDTNAGSLNGADVGIVDTLLATTTTLANSNPVTETEWVNSLLDPNVTYEYKLENITSTWGVPVFATNTTDVFAIDLTQAPAPANATLIADYFIIKNTKKWALFDNQLEMGWAVIDVNSIATLDGTNLTDMRIPNDWEVSHVTVFSSTSVPEPSILALMGLGLLGVVFTRRRKLNA